MRNKNTLSVYFRPVFYSFIFFNLFASDVLQAASEKPEKIEAADMLLEINHNINEKYPFVFRNQEFVGYPNVYSPVIFPGAQKQKILSINKGDHFLEIGCGTGVFAICAAFDGAEKVVAIDINPDAVANTLENADLHKITETLTVLQGDMFSPLLNDQQFDVIFFNIPFCHRNCKVDELTMLARSLYDPEHDLLRRYLDEGRKYLKTNGRMLLGYSTTHGDICQMHQWAKEFGWKVSLLHKEGDEAVDFITVELYQLTFASH